ncbi:MULTISPECIES: glycerophosphodiester phosphodiesterase family protein [Dickeya]|uniref:Glycerophosphoryl diester phosphodiesterase n=1 Tax=Dickeya fangzhongdai TaxID=1778540 RepID=A0A2K8QP76_9GAMM|nr:MULTISPECIES: glycerophosphodiester phosphodiesterase family protein [Dickeya]ATZ94530.1 glycerophosphoryl diester phosphodiesterase [Dickeya fangzhongdai]AYH48204.1 glycerophosphoryl diester phosphodiesterase [Dickeya fangzhongdai]MBO8134208.1 glycerophosphoryl diester phosphodiesterase [Dickeya fangzhongdai]QOH47968.1 glycerophosphoryl diester phosphodiesterase [Dickeya fangzhongdai]QOH52273.1 glycerophosphoryl diester phosphodiesterase [Dickeya fangzhongdai]
MSDAITDHLRRHRVVNDALIAHRGASALAPENTLAAMRKAAQLGATWLEVDVKLTRDNQPVIIHDDRVDRTTNGRGWVAGLTLEEIRRLDARAQFGEAFAGVTIPTLQELIACVLELDMGLQLELKPTAGDDVETAEVALGVLKSMWPANRDRLFLSSFSVRSIQAAARLMPDVPRAFAVVVPPKRPVALLQETHCQILHCLSALLDDEAQHILADSGIEYAVAIVNDAAQARRFLANGAQTILSDIPDLLG